jgi:hypothetical protein
MWFLQMFMVASWTSIKEKVGIKDVIKNVANQANT